MATFLFLGAESDDPQAESKRADAVATAAMSRVERRIVSL